MIIGLGSKIFDPMIKPKPKLNRFKRTRIKSKVNFSLFWNFSLQVMNQFTIILILLNLMMISLTGLFSLARFDLFYKQIFFWLVGFFLFFSCLFIDYRFIFEKYFFYLILVFSFLILILVLFTSGYPKSWFNFFNFSLMKCLEFKVGNFLTYLDHIFS